MNNTFKTYIYTNKIIKKTIGIGIFMSVGLLKSSHVFSLNFFYKKYYDYL